MFVKKSNKQLEYEFVCLEYLVPEDHILRKIDKYIDFTFIYDKTRHLYCQDNGRPALDPVMFFKILLIGFLFGIRSERRLVQELYLNNAYRWFVGLNLTEDVIHHSTLSKTRERRFKDNTIYEEIFYEIVNQAISHNMVGGEILFTDSTHIKASANKNKFTRKEIKVSTSNYLNEISNAVNEDRIKNNKLPFPPKVKTTLRTIRVSKTDPDSGFISRQGKPEIFAYLDHRTVDAKFNIILDTYVTPGNVHDSIPYLERLDHIISHYDFKVHAVGVDAGYWTAGICHGLIERNINGAMAYVRPSGPKGLLKKHNFKYYEDTDVYICPEGFELTYKTTNREGYRQYKADSNNCKNCPLLSKCTKSKTRTKTIYRHVWQYAFDIMKAYRLSEEGKAIYSLRKETIERSFAEAKELFGYRYARYRGIKKIQMQALLTATAQNIKKIALILARRENGGGKGPFSFVFSIYLTIFPCKSQDFSNCELLSDF